MNTPINKQTAIIISKCTKAKVNFSKSPVISSMCPIAVTKFLGSAENDLSGNKCGRFTVIGCSAFRGRGPNKVRWVAKCSCGRYQLLKTSSVKRNDPRTMCKECKHLEHLKYISSNPIL